MDRSAGGNHLAGGRVWLLYLLIPALVVVFTGRLFLLQILEGDGYQQQALENRLRRVTIPAPRGVIYDRNGILLVRNVPSYNVVVTPALLPDSEAEVELIFQELAALTGVPLDQDGDLAAPCVPGRGIRQLVEEGLTNRPYDAWPVACDVDEAVARVIAERSVDLPGVGVVAVPIRDYTTGELTAAIIGYLGPIPESQADYYTGLGFDPSRDRVGYGGIELYFQDVLAGRNGQKLVEVDVAGQILREVGEIIDPVPGNSLRLTIDTRLQAAARTALINRMEFLDRFAGERRSSIGVVIAMNPQTGEILAMVSLPTYENNRLARFIPAYYINQLQSDPARPLINHAISSTFPPGSTFKLATAVGALNEEVITPSTTVLDPGTITIANRYFPNDPGLAKNFFCWNREGHGRVAILEGIAVSCNVFFYKVGGGYPGEIPGDGLGIDRIGLYARALGYGATLGIDLPGEHPGLIPSPDWKRINLGESWSTGDTYNAATGQGFVLATPLQVLTSVATLGNGGRVMWPHIVSDELDGEGNVVRHYEPRVLWDLSDQELAEGTADWMVEPWVIELVQEGMRMVVTEGTAEDWAQLENISSAGKTGTGEFCDAVMLDLNRCEPGNWPTHAWYAAYAPAEDPEIAVIAFVYNGGEGAVTAGPIVRQVMEAYFALKAIDAAEAP